MSDSSAREDRWIEQRRLPRPRSIESCPVRYDYRSRYPECRRYAAGEGGGVHTAEGEGAYAIIADEGSLADLLGTEDDCITIYTFANADDRDRYCVARFGKLKSTQELNELRSHMEMNALVCPMPRQWDELWKMLPDRHRTASGGWEPPLPLILGAWYDASSMVKQERFLEHLRYAVDHGVMDRVGEFVRELRDDEWCRLGDA